MVSSNGSSVHVYCDITKSCGTVTGGLTRVAILNNETRHQLCTDDFMTTYENSQCVGSHEGPGCSNIVFSVMNIPYSHNCNWISGHLIKTVAYFTKITLASYLIVNYVEVCK